MSYNVAIAVPPISDADEDAWSEIDELIEAQGPVAPIFEALLERITAQYPCICDLIDNDVDDGVWCDGPLRNNLGHRASVLGVVTSRSGEVVPFLVREATRMGLAVFDWQTEAIYRPQSN